MIDILKKQREFEQLVGVPIDTILEKERNEMSEMFIFKAIEELVETRREFPSVLNKWSKNNKDANTDRVKEEISDAFLFMSNLLLAWRISWEEFLTQVRITQQNNFTKIKERKMKEINEEILNVPGYVSCVGQGSINPKYIFVGLNPGQGITHGYKAWHDPESGSSKVLIPVLKDLKIHEDCYFTNLVKSTTVENEEPSEELIKFWGMHLGKEIATLMINNPEVKVITMGKAVRKSYHGDATIDHPATVLYKPDKINEFKHQIINACGLQSSLF
mgnify:CR=1 FL=1